LALGSVPLLSGLFNPGLWRLKRQQLYTLVASIQVVSNIFGDIITICILALTKSYWARIIEQLVTTLANCLLSYIVCTYRPSFCMQHISKQYGFNTFMIGQELFGYLKSNIDTFFISNAYSYAEFGNFHLVHSGYTLT
jgi:lipopolysaccharide exporter